MYQVVYTEKALKSLKKIDKAQARFIVNWINHNLFGCTNPRSMGKAIKGNLSDWRYRVGSYRLLCNIVDEKITIEIVDLGHRKNIYR